MYYIYEYINMYIYEYASWFLTSSPSQVEELKIQLQLPGLGTK